MLTAANIHQVVLLGDYQKLAEQLEAEQREKAALAARVQELEDRALTLKEAMEATGLGRTALYEELKRARLGDSLLVPVAHGSKTCVLASSCVAYRKAKELGRHRRAA